MTQDEIMAATIPEGQETSAAHTLNARRRETMVNKSLWTKSHKINKNKWWYEDNYGIDTIGWVGPSNQNQCVHIKIPWSAIRRALARKDKP